MVDEILERLHDDLFSGHLGFKKNLQKIQERYFWTNMASDILIHCNSCLACAGRKVPNRYFRAPKTPIRVSEPFEIIAMDFLGPLHVTYSGNKYVLVFCECLTKWPEAFALPDMKDETVAKVFVEQIVCRFGAPRKLLSDKATNFTSGIIKEVCRLCNTTKIQTSAYHPQSDGLVERFYRTVTEMIAMYVSSNQRDWDTFIPFVIFAYRTSMNESTKFDPFYLVYGRKAHLPIDSALNSKIETKYMDEEDYSTMIQSRLTDAWKTAKTNIEKAQLNQKRNYDKKQTP